MRTASDADKQQRMMRAVAAEQAGYFPARPYMRTDVTLRRLHVPGTR
jgi:hypothetical protein